VLERIVQSLLLIGLDRIPGYFGTEVLELWKREGRPLGRIAQLTVEELSARRRGMVVLDVRGRNEWDAGHIPGAIHLPLGELQERLAEIPADQPIAVHCQGGGRSAIAASLLDAAGRREVANLTAGFSGWIAGGLPVEGGVLAQPPKP
jgi:hydroxyacylglutathione hydrolase